jgi:hypothetical protein
MPRGPGIPRRRCHCRQCRRPFWSPREDALTCSARCRKARNRLLGGGDGERASTGPVTDLASDTETGPWRVLLSGRHVASFGSRAEAERAVAGWLREWPGEPKRAAILRK